MTDTHIIDFGKYKGKMIGNVPADYLLWLYDEIKFKKNPFSVELREYIEDNLEVLKQEIKNSKPFFNDRS